MRDGTRRRNRWLGLAAVLVAGCEGTSGSASDEGGDTDSGDTQDTGDTGSESCVAAELRDDFSAPELDLESWIIIAENGIVIEVVDERLTFTPVPGWTEGYWGTVRPTTNFDLSECSAWVQASRMLPLMPFGEVLFEARINAEEYAMIRVGQPDLQFVLNTVTGGVVTSEVPYDEEAHRWWRFRDQGGVFSLETSPDRVEWAVGLEHAHAPDWDLGSVRLSLGVATVETTDAFDGPSFDDLNVPP
jgi:hypothetical protein